MDLIKVAKSYIFKLKKYFKNREFREKIKKEKSKKYLYSKSNRKVSFFDVYKNKKRTFTNVLVVISNNSKKYKYQFLITWATLISLSFYIIFVSPYFRISPSKVIIERLDTITDINIAYKSIEDVYSSSIFLIDKNEIKKSLAWLQKNIFNVGVTRLFPNWLKIVIESYKPEFYTKFSGIDKSYLVTSNGVLIYEKNIWKMLYNLEIIDASLLENWFFDYKEWVDEETMKKIIYLRDNFKKAFQNKNIAKLVYFKTENELHISLDTGSIIIFELNDDLYRQIALLKFYNDMNKDNLSSGEIYYVDVRIIWKVFACKEKQVCKRNLSRIYGNFYK